MVSVMFAVKVASKSLAIGGAVVSAARFVGGRRRRQANRLTMESKSGVTALNPFSYDEDITAAAEPFEERRSSHTLASSSGRSLTCNDQQPEQQHSAGSYHGLLHQLELQQELEAVHQGCKSDACCAGGLDSQVETCCAADQTDGEVQCNALSCQDTEATLLEQVQAELDFERQRVFTLKQTVCDLSTDYALHKALKTDLVNCIEEMQDRLGQTFWDVDPELAALVCQRAADAKEEYDLPQATLQTVQGALVECEQQLQRAEDGLQTEEVLNGDEGSDSEQYDDGAVFDTDDVMLAEQDPMMEDEMDAQDAPYDSNPEAAQEAASPPCSSDMQCSLSPEALDDGSSSEVEPPSPGGSSSSA